MLGRIIDRLSVAIGARGTARDAMSGGMPGHGGEVIIRDRPYRLSGIDRHRFAAEGYHADLVPRQKFACLLTLDGFRLGRPVVCMAMVEQVEHGRLAAVYLPDTIRDRNELETWWTMRAAHHDRPAPHSQPHAHAYAARFRST